MAPGEQHPRLTSGFHTYTHSNTSMPCISMNTYAYMYIHTYRQTYIHTHVLKQLLHSQKEYYIPAASCYLDNSSFPFNWVDQIYNTSSSLHEFVQPLLRNSVSLDEDSSEHCPFICWGRRSLVEWVGLSTLAGSLRRAHLSRSRTRIMVAAWWMDSSLVSNTL